MECARTQFPSLSSGGEEDGAGWTLRRLPRSSESAFVLSLISQAPSAICGSTSALSQWPAEKTHKNKAGRLQGGRQGCTHHGVDRTDHLKKIYFKRSAFLKEATPFFFSFLILFRKANHIHLSIFLQL